MMMFKLRNMRQRVTWALSFTFKMHRRVMHLYNIIKCLLIVRPIVLIIHMRDTSQQTTRSKSWRHPHFPASTSYRLSCIRCHFRVLTSRFELMSECTLWCRNLLLKPSGPILDLGWRYPCVNTPTPKSEMFLYLNFSPHLSVYQVE